MKNKELKKEFNLMWFGDSKKGKTGILATVLTCDNDGGSARIIMNFIEEQLKAKEKEVLERVEKEVRKSFSDIWDSSLLGSEAFIFLQDVLSSLKK